jgi:restriction endonuclease Mrr
MDWPDLPFRSTEEEEVRSWDLDDDIQDELTPDGFEELVADVWEDIRGCTTELTQDARDGGVDVIAEFRGLSSSGVSPLNVDKIVIQVKRYSSRISKSEIERMEGVRRRQGADEAVFVTASEYTNPAETAAEDLEIEYVDGEELIEMLNESSLDPDDWTPSRRVD